MKKTLLACAALASVALALPAAAQPGGYGGGGYGGHGGGRGACSLDSGYGGYGGGYGGYRRCSLRQLNLREESLRTRINQCVDARSMSSSAGFSLLLELARIEQAEDRATQDEVLTRFEYENLMASLDGLSRRIEFACRYNVRPENFGQDLQLEPRGDRGDGGDRLRDRNDRRDRSGERDDDDRGDRSDRDDRRSRWER